MARHPVVVYGASGYTGMLIMDWLIDHAIPFTAVARNARRVKEMMAERGIEVTLTPEALTLLGDLGYDPTYGARPLRRVIQKQLTDRLALALLEGKLREGDSVAIDARDGELVLNGARADQAAPAV